MNSTDRASRYDLILYHGNCPDGIAAAWCFWRYNRNIETIAMTYGQSPPDVRGRKVVVLDFSFKREQLLRLKEEALLFEVKDHHKSAEVDLVGLDYCEFDMTRSGCDIAWDFVEGANSQRPWFLTAISDRDLWKKVEESEAYCKAFHKARFMSFEGMDRLLNTSLHSQNCLLLEGMEIIEQETKEINKVVNESALYKFETYTVRVCTCPVVIASDVGNAMCLKGDCDFGAIWRYKLATNEWYISLRGVGKVDLSVIAARFGGGGHPNASGFTISGDSGKTPRSYFTL